MSVFITSVGETVGGRRFKHFEVTFRTGSFEQDLRRTCTGEILPTGRVHWETWSPGWCHRLKGLDISELVTVEYHEVRDWPFLRFPSETYLQALRKSALTVSSGV